QNVTNSSIFQRSFIERCDYLCTPKTAICANAFEDGTFSAKCLGTQRLTYRHFASAPTLRTD
ncbi:hypothetical protein, partial [Vibrio vulnificus]|uniref:hypothetical protein n=1 Tax=Vibrio vulnificus TaxID=672 RepID=UPI0039B438A0